MYSCLNLVIIIFEIINSYIFEFYVYFIYLDYNIYLLKINVCLLNYRYMYIFENVECVICYIFF